MKTFTRFKTGIAVTSIAHILLAFTPLASTADARPSTQRFGCLGLNDFIDDAGAVVMNTKSRYVYKRLVADRSFCEREKRIVRISVPTRDGRCRVFTCREPLRYKR